MFLCKLIQIILITSVAKSQQYDVDGLVEIFRHYGDHLYAKGNHSGAMEQYLKTIGRLEPSYVIKRVSCYLRFFKINNRDFASHCCSIFPPIVPRCSEDPPTNCLPSGTSQAKSS